MHYVIGDVHGCYEALMILLKKLNLSSEDIVTFVGDFVDREPSREQGDKLMAWFMENITEDGQFRSAIGNHDYDYYNTVRAFHGGLDLLVSAFSDEKCVVEQQEAFAQKLGKLPLYHEYLIHGVRNVVTHSWLWDRSDHPYFTDEETDGGYNIEGSIWDRHMSLYYDPKEVRVIHGHTIVISKRVKNPHKESSIATRIFKYGNNINVDCGCFMGLANRGNLAALRLEDNAEFYAYSDEDVVEECKRLAALSEGRLKDYQIFIACARYPLKLLERTDHEYINECRENLLAEQGTKGIDVVNDSSFENWMEWNRTCYREKMMQLYKQDKRFIVWN